MEPSLHVYETVLENHVDNLVFFPMLLFGFSVLVVSFAAPLHEPGLQLDIAPSNGTCIGLHASCDGPNDLCCTNLHCVRINLNITRCEQSGVTYAATRPPAFPFER